jgi:hypothetical protein
MSYDLNIDNYTKPDLLDFFGLQESDPLPILQNKKQGLISVIINDSNKDEATKQRVLDFIYRASIKLENFNTPAPTPSATLINNSTMLTDVPNPYVDEYNISRLPNGNLHSQPTTDHPIVNKPYTNFVYANTSVAFDGVVNPLERRIITKVLSIDSLYRENHCSTNSNSFTIELAAPLNNVINMKLISLELPRMWYKISRIAGNNTMKISLYNMVDYADNVQTITIPDGNYPNSVLVTMINNYFTNIGLGLNYLRFDINMTNSKAMFYVKSDPAVDTILPYDPANAHYSPNFYYTIDFVKEHVPCTEYTYPPSDCEDDTFGTYLGYQKLFYKGTQADIYVDLFFLTPSVTYYGVIVGESSCGVALDNYIFVDVNDFNKNFNTNTIMSQYNKSFIGNNILGRVALNTLPDSLLINNPSDQNFKSREYYGPVKIRKLHISLLNKKGNPIDLLNNDYSMSLEFNILYS